MWQNSNSVDQHLDRRFRGVFESITASARPIARGGTLVASWRCGRKHGPYWRLAYRDGGRQKSIYLGRCDPLVEQVRRVLDELRKSERQRQEFREMESQSRAALRRQKARWERELRARGLYTRGYAIRGTRRLRADMIRRGCPLLPAPSYRRFFLDLLA